MAYDQNNLNLIEKINSMHGAFSKGQKAIASYIVSNYDKAPFMTALKLGETVGVSESTVVRFAMELGFEGYPKFQKALKEAVRPKLTATQRMELTDDRIGEKDVLRTVLLEDIEKIRGTLEEIDKDEFEGIVSAVLKAEKIYILGVRSSAALAGFLGFYFNLMFDNVRLISTNSVSEMFEQIMRVSEKDCVIGISFPRYSRRTIEALKYAKDMGANVIGITDSKLSPITECSNHSLISRSDMVSFVDSLVAPLSVINALIVAVGMRKKEEVYNTFENLERIWKEYEVYEKYDELGDE